MRRLPVSILSVAVLAALALSGCAGSGDGAEPGPAGPSATGTGSLTGQPPEGNATTEEAPVDLALVGCFQMHTFFPFPVAMFQQLGFGLPPGFSYASSDGATVPVFLAWWSCPDGQLTDGINAPFGEVGSMFAAMPVVPPSDLAARDPNATEPQLDLLPLVWIVSSQVAANHLGGVPGLDDGYVETGPVARTTSVPGAVQVAGMQAHASFGTFDADAAFQAAGADHAAARYRLWLVPDEGDITHYLDIANGDGQALGAGEALLRFQGDPGAGAPPLTAGFSHVVDATDVLVRLVGLRAA